VNLFFVNRWANGLSSVLDLPLLNQDELKLNWNKYS